jgi:hypothetical protein
VVLPIDENYRLAADFHSWAIQRRRRRRPRKGRRTEELVDDWEPILWYPNLESAVNGLAELMLRTSDARTLEDALTEARRISATLSQALRPHIEARSIEWRETG